MKFIIMYTVALILMGVVYWYYKKKTLKGVGSTICNEAKNIKFVEESDE